MSSRTLDELIAVPIRKTSNIFFGHKLFAYHSFFKYDAGKQVFTVFLGSTLVNLKYHFHWNTHFDFHTIIFIWQKIGRRTCMHLKTNNIQFTFFNKWWFAQPTLQAFQILTQKCTNKPWFNLSNDNSIDTSRPPTNKAYLTIAKHRAANFWRRPCVRHNKEQWSPKAIVNRPPKAVACRRQRRLQIDAKGARGGLRRGCSPPLLRRVRGSSPENFWVF